MPGRNLGQFFFVKWTQNEMHAAALLQPAVSAQSPTVKEKAPQLLPLTSSTLLFISKELSTADDPEAP